MKKMSFMKQTTKTKTTKVASSHSHTNVELHITINMELNANKMLGCCLNDKKKQMQMLLLYPFYSLV